MLRRLEGSASSSRLRGWRQARNGRATRRYSSKIPSTSPSDVHRVELLAEVRRPRQALHVPAEVLAKLDRGAAAIGLVVGGHARVIERDREALLDRRRRAHRPALEEVARLVEDPRLTERSARDHHAGAPGLAVHAHRVLRAS